MTTITQYLEHPKFIMLDVSPEMLDFLSTPEQKAITRKMIAEDI